MTVQEAAQDIDAAAAAWAIRLEEHGDDETIAAELTAWLSVDRRRSGALLRAQAALSLLDRGRALAMPVHPTRHRPQIFSRLSRRGVLFGGAATAVAAAVAGIVSALSPGRRFETLRGEIRRVPLADGSIAAINTSSELDVALKPNLRKIDLVRGEAWFDVAKDASRPFLVAAGQVRVRAVGTAFSVRRRDIGADILVTEGTVETWVVGAEDAKLRLSAGKRAFVSDDKPATDAKVAPGEMDRSLAWRDGQIALGGETLSYAVAEFNRYNNKKIVITDAALASQKLVGQFRTNEPEAFANAVAGALGATVADDGSIIRIQSAARR